MTIDADVGSDVPALYISELTGPQRQIVLRGRALPYRPFNLKNSQRVEVSWNPGSPVGVGTLLGSSIGPTSLKGAWKTKYLGAPASPFDGGDWPMRVNGNPVETAVDAEKLFEQLCTQGQQLRLVWNHVTRRGYLKDFERDWATLHDLEYTLAFEWTDNGADVEADTFNGRSIGRLASDALDLAAALAAALAEGADLVADARDTLLSYQQKIASYSDQLDTLGQTIADIASTPVSTASNGAAILGSLADTANSMMDFLQSYPPAVSGIGASYEQLFGDGGANPFGTTESQFASQDQATAAAELPGNELAVAVTQFAIFSAAKDCRDFAVESQAALSPSTTTGLLAVYRARAGEDMRSISIAFYGDASLWVQLMLYNGLSSSVLTASQQVLIPQANDPAMSGSM